jgi:spore maturation protein CgeB
MKILIIEQVGENYFYPSIFFKEKGYEVLLFDLTKYYSKFLLRVIKKVTPISWKSWISHQILQEIINCKPDIIFFYNLEYIDLNTIYKIKNLSQHTKLICWHGDDFLNPKFDVISQRQKLPLIDIHVTPRHHLENEYLSLGAKEVVKINWYYKSKRITPLESIYDINFFGSLDKKRENYISQLDFKNFIIGGYGWNKSNINAIQFYKHLSLNKMNDLIAVSKISLNFLTDANRDRTNFRNFEIPSQFSLQFSERSEEICEIFTEDHGIVCFQSPIELIDKLKYYLKNESLRKKIILNSYEIISDERYSIQAQLKVIYKRISKL